MPTKEAGMQTKTLDVLFEETLRDMYSAERKILRTLPKLARTAQSPDLRAALKTHGEETQLHVEPMQQVFELLDKPARGKTCPAIDGIIEEGEEVMKAFADSPAQDASLIAAAQVEHYEISRYGTLVRWAQVLGLTDLAAILEQTLQEETMTDETLTLIADGSVNQAA
jgi:ferritin-like metal-binding protein YciE